MVDKRSETGEAHYLGPVLGEFLREVLPEDDKERDGRIIY